MTHQLQKLRRGAKTRKGTPCKRKAEKNGRCRNHGGLSTGPKTVEGRARIAEAQRRRWAQEKALKRDNSEQDYKILQSKRIGKFKTGYKLEKAIEHMIGLKFIR